MYNQFFFWILSIFFFLQMNMIGYAIRNVHFDGWVIVYINLLEIEIRAKTALNSECKKHNWINLSILFRFGIWICNSSRLEKVMSILLLQRMPNPIEWIRTNEIKERKYVATQKIIEYIIYTAQIKDDEENCGNNKFSLY